MQTQARCHTALVVLALLTLAVQPARAGIVIGGGVASFYAPPDCANYAVVATYDGVVRSLKYDAGGNVLLNSTLGYFAPGSVVGVSGYHSAYDNTKHAIVAQRNGTVTEIYWGWWGVSADTLFYFAPGSFGNIVGIAGYYTPNDLVQHVVVAFDNGTIYRIRWGAGAPFSVNYFWWVPGGTQALSAHYTANDQMEHIIWAPASNAIPSPDLTETYFRGTGGVSLVTLAGSSTMFGPISIASLYANWSGTDVSDVMIIENLRNQTFPYDDYSYGPQGHYLDGVGDAGQSTVAGAASYQPADQCQPLGIKHVLVATFGPNGLSELYENHVNQTQGMWPDPPQGAFMGSF
jgi:hypothetical protein